MKMSVITKAGVTARICTVALSSLISVLAWSGTAAAAQCMGDAAGDTGLNCTANDLGVASVTVTNVIDNDCGGAGTFTFDGTLNLNANSTTRYDLGFYIGADSEQAITGTCSVFLIPPAGATQIDGDSCGDSPSNTALGVPVSNVTVVCNDAPPGDGFFDLAICASYDNNSQDNCTGTSQLIPGTSAKCQCAQIPTNLEIPHCDVNADCTDDGNACTTEVCVGLNQPGADGFGCAHQNNTLPCRASAGICDAADNCSNGSCPDNFLPTTTVCRGDAGDCDVAEVCTGSTAACPGNSFDPNGTGCTSDGNLCTNDVCDANGNCQHNNNTVACDDGEFCTLNDLCSNGDCVGGGARDCSDNVDCTNDSCDEANDECDNNPDDAFCEDGDACTDNTCSPVNGCIADLICGDVCRSPGFWATHSGFEKKNVNKDAVNVGQLVLDAAGGLTICGQTVDASSNGAEPPFVDGLGLSSNLEGLCMRAKGVKQRQLFRQLTAAALNCVMSAGTNCEDITGRYIDVSYDDCDLLCQTGVEAEEGPTVGDCIHELDCFNNGGQMINGNCAFGNCEVTDELCGADEGDCPDANSAAQDCVPFEDNCHSNALCKESIDVCPKAAPASSSSACREARGNDCTIDACP
jgi:hypothetical protein